MLSPRLSLLGTREMRMAERTFTAVDERDGTWWIGWMEELPSAYPEARMLGATRGSLLAVIPLILVGCYTSSQTLAAGAVHGVRRKHP